MKTPKRDIFNLSPETRAKLLFKDGASRDALTRWKRKNRIKQLKRSLNKMQQVFDFQNFKINALQNSLNKIDFMRTEDMTREELAILLCKKLATALHVFELLDHQIPEVDLMHTSIDLNVWLKTTYKIAEELKDQLENHE